MSPRRVPAIGSPIDVFQSQVRELINRAHVFTSAPSLESMEVGESAFGNGTESLPSAGSDALYYKPDKDKIVCLASDGDSFSVRFIPAATLSAGTTFAQTNDLLEEVLALVSLLNAHLQILTETDLELGETSWQM